MSLIYVIECILTPKPPREVKAVRRLYSCSTSVISYGEDRSQHLKQSLQLRHLIEVGGGVVGMAGEEEEDEEGHLGH